MKEFRVPRRLDDPPFLLFWRIDSVIVVTVFFVLGTLLQIPLAATLLGIVLARLWARVRDDGKRGMLGGICYWYTPVWLRGRPLSYVQEYHG